MMSAGAAPRVSVIVPVHNGAATIERCVAALRQNPPDLFELIVVDDRSTDRTAALASSLGAIVVANPTGSGPGAARNAGAAHARGGLLLFIDADVEVQPTTIPKVVAHFEQHPELTALFGSYDDEPAAANFASQYRNLLHHFIHQTSERRSASFWGGCGAIRRAAFLAAGGFDAARYPHPSIEDIELGMRLADAGQVVHGAPEIQVKHLKAWTGLSMIRSDIVDRAVPWSQLILDHGRLHDDLNLRWAHRMSAVLVGLLTATLTFLAFGHQRFYGIPAKPAAWVVVVLLLAQLVPLNQDFYRFLIRRRGWLFAVRAVPVHLLYYFYSGTTFVACWTLHQVRRPFGRRRRASSRLRPFVEL